MEAVESTGREVYGRSVAPFATTLSDVADLVAVLVWPAIVLVLLWYLREPLRGFAERASQQAQRVSVGSFAIDFGQAVHPVSDRSTAALAQIREPDPTFRVTDSTAASIMEELRRPDASPDVLVDLGEGQEWLTSRLYIFAILLQRMRRTRSFIFVEAVGGVRGQFLGLAEPSGLRWALASAYPWLEADYIHAYASVISQARSDEPVDAESFILDDAGRLPEPTATLLVNKYLDQVQKMPPDVAATAAPGWTTIQRPKGTLTEHAAWLSGQSLERVLGSALDRFAYISTPSPRPTEEITRRVLEFSNRDVVALVDERHRFRGEVVNRQEALDAIAEHLLDDQDGQL